MNRQNVTNALGAVAGLGAGLSVLMLVFVLYNTWTTAELIRDCLRSDGTCAKRAADREAGTVSQLERVIQLAATCADRDGPQTTRQIAACIERKTR